MLCNTLALAIDELNWLAAKQGDGVPPVITNRRNPLTDDDA